MTQYATNLKIIAYVILGVLTRPNTNAAQRVSLAFMFQHAGAYGIR